MALTHWMQQLNENVTEAWNSYQEANHRVDKLRHQIAQYDRLITDYQSQCVQSAWVEITHYRHRMLFVEHLKRLQWEQNKKLPQLLSQCERDFHRWQSLKKQSTLMAKWQDKNETIRIKALDRQEQKLMDEWAQCTGRGGIL